MNNNKIVRALLPVGFLIFAAACGHHKVSIDPKDAAPVAGKFSMHYGWIKPKPLKFDFNITFTNNTEKAVLFYLTDINCSRGNVVGTVTHTFFNVGHRTFKYHPGGSESVNMACKLDSETKGDYKVTIGRVYENPGGDGVTEGKVIATNVVAVQAEEKE